MSKKERVFNDPEVQETLKRRSERTIEKVQIYGNLQNIFSLVEILASSWDKYTQTEADTALFRVGIGVGCLKGLLTEVDMDKLREYLIEC